jgi:hypothetical protein
MLRKIALSVLMLASLVVMLPLVNSTAHSIKYEAAQNQRRVRRHSRAWWRRHRALMRRRRVARLMRQRALAGEAPQTSLAETSENHVVSTSAVSLTPALFRDSKGAVALSLPTGWSTMAAPSKGETTFRVIDPNGSSAGQAALSVVAAAAPQAGRISLREQSRILGGVSYSDLRRTVIEKMITAGGWVVNDVERDMGGRKVFVVIAQTPAANDGHISERIWNFYFTEVNGRVYSLSTNAGRQTSGRIASDAEKFITSLPTMAPGATRSPVQ